MKTMKMTTIKVAPIFTTRLFQSEDFLNFLSGECWVSSKNEDIKNLLLLRISVIIEEDPSDVIYEWPLA